MAGGDQLAAGAAHRRGERSGPDVLVDQHAGRGTGVEGRGGFVAMINDPSYNVVEILQLKTK